MSDEKVTIINGQYYAEAGAFVTAELSRYTLRAIRVEPHPVSGALIIATDGHTMGVFHDARGVCAEPILLKFRREVLPFLKPAKQKNPKLAYRCLRVNGDMEVVEAGIGKEGYELGKAVVRFFDPLESGQFPKWQEVMPKEVPPLRSDFNADYLLRCALTDKRVSRAITIWHEESNTKPAIVRDLYREDFMAIVMPARGGSHPAYPTYMQPLLPRPEPAKTEVPTSKKKTAKAA